MPVQTTKRLFRVSFSCLKRSICQDRLRTNIGKALKEEAFFAAAGATAERSRQELAAVEQVRTKQDRFCLFPFSVFLSGLFCFVSWNWRKADRVLWHFVSAQSRVSAIVAARDEAAKQKAVRKTPFWDHFNLKLVLLPRQARDNIGKAHSNKEMRFVHIQAARDEAAKQKAAAREVESALRAELLGARLAAEQQQVRNTKLL
jgi:hypothetical protein